MDVDALEFVRPDFDLSGRTALVTGGATGIGSAIARALGASGAQVVITTNSTSPQSTETAFAKAGKVLKTYRVDLGDPNPATLDKFAVQVVSDCGPIDILVNNAGIIRRAPAIDHAMADWNEVIGLNLTVPWRLSQLFGRGMLERGHGKIIMIASMLSYQGGINVPGYAASKHAIAGLTKSLANEWAGGGVNVNAIAPGYVETEATASLRQDAKRSADILGRIPSGRWGKPTDIGGAAVFLASDAASYINGQILAVDGGWLAR